MEFSGVGMINELPEDVLIQVLAHLTVKSLARCRCVSRSWRALIKTADFINLHLKCDRKEIMLLRRHVLLEESDGGDKEDVLSFHDPDSLDLLMSPNLSVPWPENMPFRSVTSTFLFGPCNGIVCMVSGGVALLCNPALREFKLCPPCLFDCPEGYVACTRRYGFGFDPRTNVYKLVFLHNIEPRKYSLACRTPPCLRADLYDSKTNSWRQIEPSMVPDLRLAGGSECLFNGIIHWTTGTPCERSNTCIVDPDLDAEICEEFGPYSMGNILHFNTSTEVFEEFEFPDWMDKYSIITVLDERLAVVRYTRAREFEEYEAQSIDIWVMKEYAVATSWTKQYVIWPYLVARPFFCWRNELLVVEDKDGQLATCAFRSHEIKKFQFYGVEDSFHGMLYKESLISVNELASVPQRC